MTLSESAPIPSPVVHGFSGLSKAVLLLLLNTALLHNVSATEDGARNDAKPTVVLPDAVTLEEITITAEKHRSTIQNTPISLSAISGTQLDAAGITTVEDLAHQIPGISMRSAGPGQTEYEARGLASNGGAAPTVGFYLDEVPLSPPALAQVGKVVIDPNLYDLNRIEVLRGPQGTLYGSGSMGGTIKVMTNDPKLDQFEGSIETMVSDTHGGRINAAGNVMLNLPLSDKYALRLVGSDSYRSGWIDRIVVGPTALTDTSTLRGNGNLASTPAESVNKNVNTERLTSARASLLFQATDELTIQANAMFQNMIMGGYDEFDSPPGSSQLAHYEAFPIQEGISDHTNIFSLKITQTLPYAEFTSATAYWNRIENQVQDASESFFFTLGGNAPFVSLPYYEIDTSSQLSQEFRLSSTGNGPLEWVIGAFFSNLHSTWLERSENTALSGLGATNGAAFDADNPYRVQQYAAFFDGSFHINDKLKVATGLRWYRYQSQQDEKEWGVNGPSLTPPPVALTTRAADTGFNPRFNVSFTPTADLSYYLSASKGFRPGGANSIVPPPTQAPYCTPAPLTFGPDTVWDYELGEKARLLNNRLTINADLFYIRWNGVQQAPLLACGYQYNTNAGDGRSFGTELEFNAKLTDHLSVTGSAAYTDAKITHPSTAYDNFLNNISLGGAAFCSSNTNCTAPILNVAKDTANLAVIYTTRVMHDWAFMARVSDAFTGPTYDEAYYFGIKLPSYSIVNARTNFAKGPWIISLFADNVFSKRAELSANNTSFQFNIPTLVRYSTNQPRTVGTQISYRF